MANTSSMTVSSAAIMGVSRHITYSVGLIVTCSISNPMMPNAPADAANSNTRIGIWNFDEFSSFASLGLMVSRITVTRIVAKYPIAVG